MRINRDPLILIFAVVGLVAVFVMGLYLPHRRAVATRQEQIRLRRQKLAGSRSITANAPPQTVDQSHGAISEAWLALAIPVRPDLGLLLAQIGEDLKSASVIDQELQAKAVIDGSDFTRIPMTLQFRSTFGACFHLLQRIESRKRIIRIDRFVVRQDRGDADETLRVDIDLSTFFKVSQGNTS